METVTIKAFELGVSGFMLLIVLITTLFFVGRAYNSFAKIPDKFDALTEKLAESNKELSNQLVKTFIVQENILSIMKEQMVAINNSRIKMAILENKIEDVNAKVEGIRHIADSHMVQLEKINEKLEELQ